MSIVATVAHLSYCWALVLSGFWATVCKTVRPMLSNRCLSACLSVLSV